MNEQLREMLKLSGLNKLAQNAGITLEEFQQAQQLIAPSTMPTPMTPQMPEQEMLPASQRPMNVRPSDPQRMANLQNIKQALNTDSPLDNIAMMRMQEQQPTVQAKAGTEGMTVSFGNGMVPGEGHGMQDNVQMPIMQNGDQVATLAVSPDEYIVDAHTMAALGNGSADAGADVMDKVVKEIRKKAYGTDKQPNEINGLASLRAAIG